MYIFIIIIHHLFFLLCNIYCTKDNIIFDCLEWWMIIDICILIINVLPGLYIVVHVCIMYSTIHKNNYNFLEFSKYKQGGHRTSDRCLFDFSNGLLWHKHITVYLCVSIIFKFTIYIEANIFAINILPLRRQKYIT